jgi:RNA polymerase sigma-70 factor (ECF subfamily)
MQEAILTEPEPVPLFASRTGSQGEHAQAFERFLATEADSVLRLARRLLGDEEAARDLAQDALLRAHRALAGFRGQSSLKTWVLRITVNEGLKRIRRRKLKDLVTGWFGAGAGQQAPPGYGLTRADNPERLAGLHQQAQALAAALDSLPARQRAVLVLRYLEGMGLDEIAATMGIGPGTVKTHLVRAVRRVRAQWRELDQAEEVDDEPV